MKPSAEILTLAALVITQIGCESQLVKNEKAAATFMDSLTTVVEPLITKISQAYWEATATGKDELYDEYARLNTAYKTVFADPVGFQRIKSFREFAVQDSLLKRQLEITYLEFLANQTDTALLRQITELETKVEATFNKFRAKVDGRELTGNDVKDILANSTNLKLRQKAWEASKQVGVLVEPDMQTLIRLRNQAAVSMGFDNYWQMRLVTDEQEPGEIMRIFKELENATQAPFTEAKNSIDAVLSQRLKVKPEKLQPWHYADPFFQESPVISDIDLDRFYAEKDVVELGRKFMNSIGLNVDDLVARSDLFERPGKYPHAYCTDIDRAGDVRIMLNVRNNESWMSTTLHEMGHGVYALNIDRTLPFLLREEAHAFTTEAIAIFFERLSKNPEWMQSMLGLTNEEKIQIAKATSQALRNEKLIFARWSLVMLNFEKGMYENPDQNLNDLWWNLVEKYQLIKRPENRNQPDWAAKIHICSYPVYYHNYQLGALFAAQLLDAIAKAQKLSATTDLRFVDNMELGNWLTAKVFAPGKRWRWDEMIRRATGKQLSANFFVEQL